MSEVWEFANCTCMWTQFAPYQARMLTGRDATCFMHGDGTAWWEHVRTTMVRLHAEYHSTPCEAPCDSPRISSESWGGGDVREVACGKCESCRAAP